MTKVRVMIMPSELRREFHFIDIDDLPSIKKIINVYRILPPIEIRDCESGEGSAEEVFDLTNNPSRQEERLEKYGNGQSLSSGDIVEVDGVKYLCMSFGWTIID